MLRHSPATSLGFCLICYYQFVVYPATADVWAGMVRTHASLTKDEEINEAAWVAARGTRPLMLLADILLTWLLSQVLV